MAQAVKYEHLESDGRFVVCDENGAEVVVEGGKPFSTSSPFVIAELDAAVHAVRRAPATRRRSGDDQED